MDVVSSDNFAGPNLPTLADLKIRLRISVVFQINGLRAKLERSEGEIPCLELIRGPSLPPMEHECDLEGDREGEDQFVLHEEEPVPALVSMEGETAE
uniref:Uncharacterized protein n=1 Tax=Elaeophora elaphi TaxID=1147741 RepID=A0A0R3S3R9_9BILA